MNKSLDPSRRDIATTLHKALRLTRGETSPARTALVQFDQRFRAINADRYNSRLHSTSDEAATKVEAIAVRYAEDAPLVDGREVLQANFEALFSRDPRLVAFGEDVGKIGDVNQGFAGLQAKFGELRIADMGIREATIAGQGIGLALRGLRPIAEIQYLDYLLYALQILSDDLATLQYRTKGGQKPRSSYAPVAIVWKESGTAAPHGHDPAFPAWHPCADPRNMTQAAGFYNTLLAGDEPGLIVECLNGYRLKERLPSNLGEYRIPLGKVELLEPGSDVTLLTYGSCVRIAQEAILMLRELGISVELIDAQSLLPFDREHAVVESLRKTNRLVILDEDVPGGASAYLLQQVLEEQQGFQYLDSAPVTITAKGSPPCLWIRWRLLLQTEC